MSENEIIHPLQEDEPVYRLHTGEAESITAMKPGFIVRWGIVALCLLYVAFLVIASLIHFPELINDPVTGQAVTKDRTLLGILFDKIIR